MAVITGEERGGEAAYADPCGTIPARSGARARGGDERGELATNTRTDSSVWLPGEVETRVTASDAFD